MKLNVLSLCVLPGPESPLTAHTQTAGGFYLKASAVSKRNSIQSSSSSSENGTKLKKSSTRSKKRKSVTSVTIGSPTGFRHEFHLGRDVVRIYMTYMLALLLLTGSLQNSMEDLWDLDRWRAEIENRVYEVS